MIPLFSLANLSYVSPLYYLQAPQYTHLPVFTQFPDNVLPQKIEKSQNECRDEEVQKIVEELRKGNIYVKKKHWTGEEDEILISLIQDENLTWKQVSEKIENTNEKICERRYTRLKQNEKLWSREDEQKIKYMREVENKKWQQINQVVKNHSSKQIRQRYINFIRSEIVQRAWTIEEDTIILKGVKQNGRKWKILERQLQGRSQNQIKNRYYGTLSFIQKKVKKRMKMRKRRNKENYRS